MTHDSRNRRYETANALAADVQRYLHDEQVLACPPSAAYRLRKFVRRNKGPVLAVGLVVLALVGGIVGTMIGLLEAKQAQQREAERANGERQAKQIAEAKEAETRAVLSFVESKIFAAARPEGQGGGLGRDVTLRKAIDAALPFVESSFTDQPLIEARLRMTLGVSLLNLGEAKRAEEQFEKARAIRMKHLGRDHLDTLRSMGKLADSYLYLGRLAEALKLAEETLSLAEVNLGPGHLDTLWCMGNLANSYSALGRHREALKLREEMLELMQAKQGPNHPDTFRCMNNLADSHEKLGRYDEALKLRQETLQLQKANLGPSHPETLASMSNLAGCYIRLGRHSDAAKLLEQTLTLKKEKLGLDHPSTLRTMHTLAWSYDELRRHADALKLTQETLALRKIKLGADHPDTLLTMNNLGCCYECLGRHAEALKVRQETLVLEKVTFGPDHPETIRSTSNVASSYYALGRHAEALKLYQETLALRKAKLGPRHPDTLRSMGYLAETLFKVDRGAEAVPIIDECLQLAAGKAIHRLTIDKVLRLRVRHFQSAKDVAGCRATAEMREQLHFTNAAGLYNAACARAVTAAVLRATDQSAEAAKEANAESDRAMAWLQQAVAAGYRNVKHMKKDTDLDPLRDRDDFKRLLSELEAKKAKEIKR